MTPNYCVCCIRRREAGVCPCVIGVCRRCVLCVRHCTCPERFAARHDDGELDDPSGPFADLPHRVAATPASSNTGA